jgi:hypothetical protein
MARARDSRGGGRALNWNQLCRKRQVRFEGKTFPSMPPNAICQLPRVTAPQECWLEAGCHQNDTSTGVAGVNPKIRLTTLLNCSRSFRPPRATDYRKSPERDTARSNVRQSLADSGNRRDDHKTTYGEFVGRNVLDAV